MPDPIPVNPSPKARYLSNPSVVKEHRNLTQNNGFERAIDTSLLQYQFELSNQRVDGGGAAANHFKMTGALEFVHLLKSLAETPQRAPATKDRDNLSQT